ncbi:uncharacterized protein BXIN_1064 [Babesia sp. Xinjiang]|uniref:uncharacterized protein n=1 Tax=Babesia sp. Xinjiang TaxID=462227 RepID=UPI000A250611|nr:uncharacterized protein BXIN_1064 [Babesia sp. Xinjiang]ORM41985.1 hypothetical protein BXIN_1064 [Babesia sp. Xinjiang]
MKATPARGARAGDSSAPSKRRKAANAPTGKAASEASPAVTTEDATSTEVSSIREKVRNNLRARFQLAARLLPAEPATEETKNYSSQAPDTIVTLCKVLNQPYSVVLTALVYLQMYKNASDRWNAISSQRNVTAPDKWRSVAMGSCEPSTSSSEDMDRHEHFLVAASCVLLAWKYREDDVRVAKSAGKIFEFTSVLYKLYVAQDKNCSGTPSVSSWMLQDEGKEITKLKMQLLEHETHLLHALDYHVGPVLTPHKLIPAYVRKFLIAIANDLSDLHELAQQLDNLVGLLLLECYKTRICIDYNPGEILVSCIFKAACLLTVSGAYPHVFGTQSKDYFKYIKEMNSRLNNFISALGKREIGAERIAQCLADMRLLMDN